MARRISSRHRPILCAVLAGRVFGSDPRTFAARLFEAGVDWIQLRDRSLGGQALYALACELVAAARGQADQRLADRRNHETQGLGSRPVQAGPGSEVALDRDRPRVLINRRVDIALASAADGVQLGFDAIQAREARVLLGESALIGASLHALAEVTTAAAAAKAEPAALAYVQLAPIWDPNSKPASRPALGAAVLAEACRAGIPVLAQGGLDESRAERAIGAGALGIAVTGLLENAADPIGRAERLRTALDRAAGPGGGKFRNRLQRSGDTEAAQ
jgi:thiamine-phosphate diphosphorylase